MKVCGDHAPTGWVCRKKMVRLWRIEVFILWDHCPSFSDNTVWLALIVLINLSDANLCYIFRKLQGSLLFDRICSTKSLLPRGLYLWNDFVTCMLCLKMGYPIVPYFSPFHPLVYHHVPHSNGEIAEKPHESGLMINPATISIFLDSDSRWRDWVTTPVISRKVLPINGLWAYSIHKMWKKICFSERNSLVNYSVSKAIPNAYNISFMFPYVSKAILQKCPRHWIWLSREHWFREQPIGFCDLVGPIWSSDSPGVLLENITWKKP